MISRKRTMGKKEDTYIQDGLVFWLDGINKGNDPTAWTDLINGIGFPYNSGQEIRNDSVYFNGSAGLTSSSPSLNHLLNSCQIEVVVDNNFGLIITPNKESNIAFGFPSRNSVAGISANWGSLNYVYGSPFPSQKTSYSMSMNHLYYDDIILTPSNYDRWRIGKSNLYEIGERNTYYKYVGNIYSIRIYNRHLTDEERIHNNNIDKQRFNL